MQRLQFLFSALAGSSVRKAADQGCRPPSPQHKLARRDDEAQFIDSTATTPLAWFPD
jgi:hypothetical protein